MRRGIAREVESADMKAAAFAQERDPACDERGVRMCLSD